MSAYLCTEPCSVALRRCRVSLDGVSASLLSPAEEALVSSEVRTLKAAWGAAERRYASVLREMREYGRVQNTRDCFHIASLRCAHAMRASAIARFLILR